MTPLPFFRITPECIFDALVQLRGKIATVAFNRKTWSVRKDATNLLSHTPHTAVRQCLLSAPDIIASRSPYHVSAVGRPRLHRANELARAYKAAKAVSVEYAYYPFGHRKNGGHHCLVEIWTKYLLSVAPSPHTLAQTGMLGIFSGPQPVTVSFSSAQEEWRRYETIGSRAVFCCTFANDSGSFDPLRDGSVWSVWSGQRKEFRT